jgi:hypothetical protein
LHISYHVYRGGPLCYAVVNGQLVSPYTSVACPSVDSFADFFVPPPLFPPTRDMNMMVMSQRTGSVTYHMFAAGFGGIIWYIWHLISDQWGRAPKIIYTALYYYSVQAIFMFTLGDMLQDSIRKTLFPSDSPPSWCWLATPILIYSSFIATRYLTESGVMLRM